MGGVHNMRIRLFFVISLLLHFLAAAIYSLGLKFHFDNNDYSSYFMVQDAPAPKVEEKKAPAVFNDEGLKISKKITQTNDQKKDLPPNASVDGQENGKGSSTGFLPSYMVGELPIALTPIDPSYPEEAKRLGIEGKVVLFIYIDENGIVKKVEVKSSPHDSLSQSAQKAVFETKFTPAKISGEKNPVVLQLALRFKLE
jgi:protein TonB